MDMIDRLVHPELDQDAVNILQILS